MKRRISYKVLAESIWLVAVLSVSLFYFSIQPNTLVKAQISNVEVSSFPIYDNNVLNITGYMENNTTTFTSGNIANFTYRLDVLNLTSYGPVVYWRVVWLNPNRVVYLLGSITFTNNENGTIFGDATSEHVLVNSAMLTGLWTVEVQVFASDFVTPLGFIIVPFTVLKG